MYRKDQENRPLAFSQYSYSSISTPTYGQSKNKHLEKKVSFPGNQEFSQAKDRLKERSFVDRKSSNMMITPPPQPLSFSGNMIYKKKKSLKPQFRLKSSESESSNSSRIGESTSIQFMNHQFTQLRHQNQQLRSQHKLLISHLLQTKKTLQGISKMYTEKCQEAQTLKSIITSLKQYICSERSQQITPQVYSKYNIYQQNLKEGGKYQRKISGDKKIKDHALRRISINQALMTLPYGLKGVEVNDIKAFDSYIRQQCVESVKGSAYDIYSSSQLF